MTVNELIDELQKIKDKNKKIMIYCNSGSDTIMWEGNLSVFINRDKF